MGFVVYCKVKKWEDSKKQVHTVNFQQFSIQDQAWAVVHF